MNTFCLLAQRFAFSSARRRRPGYGICAGVQSLETKRLLSATTTPTRRLNTPGKIALHEGIHQQVDSGQADVVFIGDSITQRWADHGATPFAKHFGDYETINMGIGGDATQSVLWRLQDYDLTKIGPKVVVLQVGTNNLCWPSRGTCTGHDTALDTAKGVQANVDYLRTALPNTHVLLLGLFPREQYAPAALRQPVVETNQLISVNDHDQYVHYMDVGDLLLESNGDISSEIMFDYLHLTEAGYDIVATSIAPTVHALVDNYEPPQVITQPVITEPIVTETNNAIVDVDGDGTIAALSDGILLVRFLAGFRGDALVAGAVNSGATRSDADSISGWLQEPLRTALDVDANGQSTALGDGLLALRHMAGFQGNALVDGVVDTANGTRTTPRQITDHLDILTGKAPGPTAAGPAAPISNPITTAQPTSLRDSEQHTAEPNRRSTDDRSTVPPVGSELKPHGDAAHRASTVFPNSRFTANSRARSTLPLLPGLEHLVDAVFTDIQLDHFEFPTHLQNRMRSGRCVEVRWTGQ